MLHLGEILTLVIGLVAVVYLVFNWRELRAIPTLRPFIVPLFFMFVSWTSAVVEDLFPPGGLTSLSFSLEETVGAAEAGTLLSTIFNLMEHAGIVAAALAILLAARSIARQCREGPR
jgi:hypothetical protein